MGQIFDYELADGFAHMARLGMVILQTDETLEHDLQRLIPTELASIYATRIPNATVVNKETLAKMAEDLPYVTSLLPNTITYDAVGYGCTSGTSVIGAERIKALVQEGCPTNAVTDPLTALIAACDHMGIKRLAFLSPYLESVSDHLRNKVRHAGIESPLFGTFNEEIDPNVARITRSSIVAAATQLGQQGKCDAVFLSCTNLRTLDVISEIEANINKPVLSSNQVLVWHLAQLADIQVYHNKYGCLWQAP